MDNGITVQNLLRTLPSVLQNDENMLALATSLATVLSRRVNEIGQLQIYARIDQLPEDLLDILAHDFKVDWYDYNYEVEIKRALIKDSFNVHRHLGTRGAVETALSDIYPGAVLNEWHEYNGMPYRFKVNIDASEHGINEGTYEKLEYSIEYYKSLRSKLECITVSLESKAQSYVGGAIVSGEMSIFFPDIRNSVNVESKIVNGLACVSGEAATLIPEIMQKLISRGSALIGCGIVSGEHSIIQMRQEA